MLPGTQGSFRLFRLFGIEVRLHWAWFLAVAFFASERVSAYHNSAWAVAECLSLFAIVLMHEFGHALACRSVGGTADRIILWPLGGVAFVNPPMRPGAMLWSIAAGPLVNVALVPVTVGLVLAYSVVPTGRQQTDIQNFLQALLYINGALLAFNLLPIYPLDGGQILQSILWFFLGFARSLRFVSVIGLIVGVVGGGVMLLWGEYWLGLMAIFVVWQAWRGYQLAGAVLRAQREHAEAIAAAHSAQEPWNQAS